MVLRELPTDESRELLAMVAEVGQRQLAPHAASYEDGAKFPRETFRTLGQLGLLGLPYPTSHGGGEQPFTVYLQVIEELSRHWLAVGLGVSVHTLSCHPVAAFGSVDQQAQLLPSMTGGDLLGAYCLSEAHSGSDAAGLTTRADLSGDGSTFTLNGTKAWITHSGVADYYLVMARTDPNAAPTAGISCFWIPADTVGVSAGRAERKMGLNSSRTAPLHLDNVRIPAHHMIGEPGDGFRIAMAALDSGRLGIAACAVGLAQAAFDTAARYAQERTQFGQPIGNFQGLSFLLADMATGIAAARALYLSGARLRDAGQDYSLAAAQAKLFATDTAMKVATDAVQVLGGSGYVRDFPAERYFREAKLLQIVEGTNQIQRLVIGRTVSREYTSQ